MKKLNDLYLQIQNHIISDEKPSEYLNSIYNLEEFKLYPFDMLYKMGLTEQSKKYHPEGNVWNHTMLVIDMAASVKDKSSDELCFMWASLLHDVGKPVTTKTRKGRITSYDHDVEGEKLAKEFLLYFTNDQKFVYKVSKLVRYHMHILYVVKDLPFKRIDELKKETDVNEIALLGYCDRMGRLNPDNEKEKQNVNKFYELVSE